MLVSTPHFYSGTPLVYLGIAPSQNTWPYLRLLCGPLVQPLHGTAHAIPRLPSGPTSLKVFPIGHLLKACRGDSTQSLLALFIPLAGLKVPKQNCSTTN